MSKDASGDDRREHSRYPVRLLVHFAAGDKRYRLVSENLSLGGIFLKAADEGCFEGDPVKLDIVVRAEGGRTQIVAVPGVVAQRIDGAGVGIRFEWDDADKRARPRLEAFIREVGMLEDPAMHQDYVGLATDAEEER